MPENREKHNGKSKFYISPTDRLDLLSALTKAQAVEEAKGKKHKKLLEQVDLFVMVALIGHRNNQTGQCDPSHATIAREIGVSESTVKRSFKRLIAAGFMIAIARSFKGRQTSSQVDINFKKGEAWITQSDDGRSRVTERSGTDDPTVGHGRSPRSVTDDLDGRSQMTDEPSARNAEKERREKNPNASRQDEPSDLGSSQVSDQLKADNDNRLADWPEDWRDRFWNAYPMRKNIKAAEVALVSVAKAGVKFESVLVAARRHGHEVSDRQFYKDPVKWMADEPWLDNAKAREQVRRAQYSMAI
ncbi:helix-turn-helix domain-containing protein [Bradyrhizobium diazoefficiens]|uniref:helix-turn-helix domain-containing protein n=1 Tax=Bradyrhizobium diazoefficiens TaxID=1355477 RepID=UPI001B8C8EE1|nr:helix-turn-helix domain-containing protein [Bradyrhizobium diazoefficiens]MBR0861864.1 helix-turn-helix domain-containing protein [Bradyrhizobium diazoefficiens]MBR0886349.1 helix-turn-helix domain-containing protein [Bradyrhizobium diazoefficiens]MBR0918091.1 helix-turn-helix domain-containing protein [Bradyrhizobium diazoefficiens]